MKRAALRTQDWSNPKSSSPSYNIPGGFQLRKFLISGTWFLHRCYFYILGLAKGTAAKQGSQLRGQIPECSVLPWTFLGVKANSSLAMKAWGALKQVLALSLVYNWWTILSFLTCLRSTGEGEAQLKQTGRLELLVLSDIGADLSSVPLLPFEFFAQYCVQCTAACTNIWCAVKAEEDQAAYLTPKIRILCATQE